MNRTWFFRVSAVYSEPDWFFKEFEFDVPIEISKVVKWTRWNWNRVLMLKWQNVTFAEVPEWTNATVWNKNFLAIKDFIIDRFTNTQ